VALRRGVGIVLGLLTLAVIVSVAGLLVIYLLVQRGPQVARNSTLVLRVGGELEEVVPPNVFAQLVSRGAPPTVRGIVETLRKAKVDSRINGVLLVPTALSSMWAKVQEIRDAIVDFRRSGKPIVAFMEYGGDQEYYLASACDRIYLVPVSTLDLDGLTRYDLFIRGTLDKLNIYPDALHIGEYKTAADMFTEKNYTPAHREMAESLMQDLYEQLVRGIAEGRKKPEPEVRRLLDQGPFLPEDALQAGLIDELAYEDQLDDKRAFGERELRKLEAKDYAAVSLSSLGLGKGPQIAVIYASGMINTGRSEYDPMNGQVLGSDTVVEHIRSARADSAVRAIVVRVDSPGGSAIASDVVWRELMLTRNLKPLIVSMSDLAASGGYYISVPAHAIVAQPATLTGSIGVVALKLVTGGLYEKLGMHVASVSRGRMAEIYSPLRPFSPEERAKVEAQMQAIYQTFVEKTAEGRHTSPERIDAIGQGRVWTGRQAKQIGLIDELGGLDRAVALAKQRAKIPPDTEVELVVYPPRKNFYELLAEQFGGSEAQALRMLVRMEPALRAAAALRVFRRGEPLMMMAPFNLP